MILIDTTVWIDFFVNRNSSHVDQLVHYLEDRTDVCICGPILTEILQGIKNPLQFKRTKELLDSLLFLEMSKPTFLLAAEFYKYLRLRGITIRKTIDCMIAAVAVENNATLLHNDRDFLPMSKYCGLKIV